MGKVYGSILFIRKGITISEKELAKQEKILSTDLPMQETLQPTYPVTIRDDSDQLCFEDRTKLFADYEGLDDNEAILERQALVRPCVGVKEFIGEIRHLQGQLNKTRARAMEVLMSANRRRTNGLEPEETGILADVRFGDPHEMLKKSRDIIADTHHSAVEIAGEAHSKRARKYVRTKFGTFLCGLRGNNPLQEKPNTVMSRKIGFRVFDKVIVGRSRPAKLREIRGKLNKALAVIFGKRNCTEVDAVEAVVIDASHVHGKFGIGKGTCTVKIRYLDTREEALIAPQSVEKIVVEKEEPQEDPPPTGSDNAPETAEDAITFTPNQSEDAGSDPPELPMAA